MQISDDINKLLLELRPTFNELKKQYKYLDLDDDFFEQSFINHINPFYNASAPPTIEEEKDKY